MVPLRQSGGQHYNRLLMGFDFEIKIGQDVGGGGGGGGC